ncbi:MAG: S24/S26 family peptidase [Paludibacteraceae bacterium]|nr:S24/S26 family peptidase [Paludibacteraceae bacterium]
MKLSETKMDEKVVSSFEETLQVCGILIYENEGDSMLPLIRQGRDKVIIVPKPEGRLKKYDVPLYRRDNGKYVLHRVMRVRTNDYVICGDNRWRCETGIGDQHIIGVLSGVIRKGKTIKTTDNWYRWYVRLWCWPFLLRRAIFMVREMVVRGWRRLKG